MQSSSQPEVRWDRMTAPALIKAARENAVVIIPLGATEQHGPHLPVQVDARLAGEVCVRAARIAAHVGDMVKLGRKDRDMEMSKARRDLRWDDQQRIGMFGERAAEIRASRAPEDSDTCTMCGAFCALDNVNAYFKESLSSGDKR